MCISNCEIGGVIHYRLPVEFILTIKSEWNIADMTSFAARELIKKTLMKILQGELPQYEMVECAELAKEDNNIRIIVREAVVA